MSIKKQRIVILIVALLFALALSTRFPKWDSNWDTPASVAKDFVSAAQAGDLDKARSYWSDGSVANIEWIFRMSFADYCRSYFECRDFRVGSTYKQKGGFWSVDYRPRCSSAEDHQFYVQRIDGVYRLTCHRWGAPDSVEPESEEPESEELEAGELGD